MPSSCLKPIILLSSLAAREARVVKKGTTAKLEAPVKAEADDQEALRYLESRGLKGPEMIGHFQLGFANGTLGYRLPDKNKGEGAELRGRLQTRWAAYAVAAASALPEAKAHWPGVRSPSRIGAPARSDGDPDSGRDRSHVRTSA